jgi:NAD(P)-dependent dehydrogenase (short-subunit alcohol dehydrogenase family)
MSKLDGKVAVITGGNSGIGLASAKRFVEEGAHVFITGRRQSELDTATKQIRQNVTAVQDKSERAFARHMRWLLPPIVYHHEDAVSEPSVLDGCAGDGRRETPRGRALQIRKMTRADSGRRCRRDRWVFRRALA